MTEKKNSKAESKKSKPAALKNAPIRKIRKHAENGAKDLVADFAFDRKKIAIALEKHGKKTKQKIWLDLAKRIVKPKRTLPKVNIWKINKFAQKQKGKVFVVAGHVLSAGELTSGVKIAALNFSKKALEKIKNANGKAFSLSELMDAQEKTSSMVVIK